ncbi:uncharacterized protein Z520_11731 [Fonsecaea multimorphosa CBS 102226]|uniref:Uncharacterized protein n=1 Tax=Fonsecaea multimorphosa CBS 102226 TaxID=1442371 RepID=A0A0D2GSV4_9EURO|nr:uncharacterized protein Z520_11731 [Fonsecaea multimorphosa CBS 102226]KIX92555.1 hypothetical protein Z520_11731 [Fonsecaea multimorphosa CBS 102226]
MANVQGITKDKPPATSPSDTKTPDALSLSTEAKMEVNDVFFRIERNSKGGTRRRAATAHGPPDSMENGRFHKNPQGSVGGQSMVVGPALDQDRAVQIARTTFPESPPWTPPETTQSELGVSQAGVRRRLLSHRVPYKVPPTARDLQARPELSYKIEIADSRSYTTNPNQYYRLTATYAQFDKKLVVSSRPKRLQKRYLPLNSGSLRL